MHSTMTDPQATDLTAAQSDLAWIGEQLAKTSYKPGWTFELEIEKYVGPAIVIAFETGDAYNPGKKFTAESIFLVVDAPTDAAMFARWLLAAACAAEIHEACESFKVDGKLVLDPHAGNNRVWTMGLYDAINAAAAAGQDPLFAALFAAAVPAVEAGTVPPDYKNPSACIDQLPRNIPLRGAPATPVA